MPKWSSHMISYKWSIVTIYSICIVFKLYPLKDPYKRFDLENRGQGQIQGHQIKAHIWFPINVQ